VIVLGYAFVAAPLAAFGTEHLLAPRLLIDLVPSWIPAPQALEEVNYVGDTLLFGGTVLLIGIAVTQPLPAGLRLTDRVSRRSNAHVSSGRDDIAV
jgi:hypothetical protein